MLRRTSSRGGRARRALTLCAVCALSLSLGTGDGLVVLVPAASAQELDGLPMGWNIASTDSGMTLSLDAYDQLENIQVEIGARGQTRTPFSKTRMTNGQRWEIELPPPSSTTTYTLRIRAKVGELVGEMNDEFTIDVAAPLDFRVDEDTFDEAARRFVLTMTQPAGHVEVTVRGETGQLLAERVVNFNGEPPGTPLTVNWSQADGQILTVDVKVVAQSGAWSSKQYIPWKVEFDPVSINFATGSAEIPESDFAMLRTRVQEIQATADRVKEWVEVKLYVGGYTDTVGNNADNKRLSEARAQALGQFFEDNGISFSIFYQGFGEEALAVQTADNVDEPANRRSIFILSTQSPPTSANIPSSSWRELN